MKRKKVLIICRLDGFANSIRPKKIKALLERKNFEVNILDAITLKINEENKNKDASIIKKRLMEFLKRYFLDYLINLYLKSNGKKLYNIIKNKNYDAIICETEMDAYLFFEDIKAIKILDLPTPLIEELYQGKLISKKKYEELIKKEIELYKRADFLSFHWHTYTDYVKKNIYNGKNLLIANWGCEPKPKDRIAKFSNKPRIIFMGYLEGYWNNLPLLSKLSKLYPIDVYGGPEPDKKWGLNYKGYAKSTDILSNYQFGLITITKDRLRKSSFSSKHLEYLSYGLPVLTPNWRKDKLLDNVSIHYNEKNFLKKIKEYSNKKEWRKRSKKCYAKSRKLNWGDNLKMLINIFKNKTQNNLGKEIFDEKTN